MAAPSPADDVTLTFGGNATTLLRLGPFTLLTDPNFLHRGQRAYLGKGLWSRRLTEPSMQPEDLLNPTILQSESNRYKYYQSGPL